MTYALGVLGFALVVLVIRWAIRRGPGKGGE